MSKTLEYSLNSSIRTQSLHKTGRGNKTKYENMIPGGYLKY